MEQRAYKLDWSIAMSDIIKELVRRISGLERWKNELRLPEIANNESSLRGTFREFSAHIPGMIHFVDTGLISTTTLTVNMNDAGGRPRNLAFTGTLGTDNYVQYANFDGTNHITSTLGTSDGYVLGNETFVSTNGLTLGAWVYFTTITNEQNIIARWNATTSQLMYRLWKTSSHTVSFSISTNGTSAAGTITSDVTLESNTWYLVAGRWTAGTNMSITINSTIKTAATVVNAPLANASNLYIARSADATNPYNLTGRIAYPFIAATPISDANLAKLNTLFTSLYVQSG
jgi:hypothetical protein